MIPKIEKFIVNNYDELRKISKTITKNSDWADDLLQDVILQLYQKKNININNINDKSIKYYIVKCLTINWFSETSPFFRKVKRESTLYNELFDSIEITNTSDELDNHKLMDIIEIEWTSVEWFHKVLFEKYLILNSLKKVSLDTTIPITSVSRYINETKRLIKQNTLIKFNQ